MKKSKKQLDVFYAQCGLRVLFVDPLGVQVENTSNGRRARLSWDALDRCACQSDAVLARPYREALRVARAMRARYWSARRTERFLCAVDDARRLDAEVCS